MKFDWKTSKTGWKEAALAVIFTLIAQLVLMLLIFPAFRHYFLNDPSLWDCGHYARFIVNGYREPETRAFYPAWPLLVRIIFFQTLLPAVNHTLSDCFKPMAYFSALLNAGFLVLAVRFFQRYFKPASLAIFLFFLMAMDPLGIFRFLGYSESLFCLLSICLLMILNRDSRKWYHYTGIFVLAALMSLTRPVLVIFGTAAVGAFLFVKLEQALLSGDRNKKNGKETLWSAAALILGLIAGYSLLGYSHLHASRSFWEPFLVQSLWGKTVSPMNVFSNIIHPGTWGGTVVLIWDYLAFLAPVSLGLWSLFQLFFRRQNTPPFGFIHWFSLGISVFTAGLILLTQTDIHSLSRYVFATPFFFIPLGSWLGRLKPKTAFRVKIGLGIVTLWGLVTWWVLYATPGAWMG